MSKSVRRLAGGLAMLAVAGCHSATRVVDYPRVDLEVGQGGNRGYLVGAPPASSGPWKTTRQTVETEVEVPALGKRAASAGEAASPDGEMTDASAWDQASVSQEIIGTYTVKSGDTLWSIAAGPAAYNDATKWRLLFDANRDVLKSPDRLRAGMTLRIPRAGGTGEHAAESEPEGVTFKK